MKPELDTKRIYDPKTGKFKCICLNPECLVHEFMGRRNQLYCCLRCKNQVNNAACPNRNPRLEKIEMEIRKNYKILEAIVEKYGFETWIDGSVLRVAGFKGDKHHGLVKYDAGKEVYDGIKIMNFILYQNSSKKIFIKKEI